VNIVIVDKVLTFGLWNAQDGVQNHDAASATEDEECAVGDFFEHDGCELVGRLSDCASSILCGSGCCWTIRYILSQ
jgi:hypothetical protein